MQNQIEKALALHQQGRLAEAEVIYHQILSASPRHSVVLNFLGILETQCGHPEQAIKRFKKALANDATNPALHSNMGNALQALERHKEALQSYDRALALKPDHQEALYNRGTSLHALGRLQEALATYDRALAFAPHDASLYNNKGLVLQDLELFDEAMASYNRALTLAPQTAESAVNRGDLLHVLKRHEEALACYDQAININPDYAEAWSNKGAVYADLKQYRGALTCYDNALRIDPNLAETLLNKATSLFALKHYEKAMACCEQVLRIDESLVKTWSKKGSSSIDKSAVWFNKGGALVGLMRFEDALACYEEVLRINPKNADAWQNNGHALVQLNRYDQALLSFDKALEINPYLSFLYGTRLHTRMLVCDWKKAEGESNTLFQKIRDGEEATPPFPVLGLTDSVDLQIAASMRWIGEKYAENVELGAIPKRSRHQKIRVAYLSADFREHAGGYNFVGLFENLDKSRFEIFAISFSNAPQSEFRTRLIRAFDQFIDVENKSDREVASLMRELEIDIAVDIMGPTSFMRAEIFAMRAAPIQVNQFGWPSCAPYMDYMISDGITIPVDQLPLYREKIACLPHTFFPTDNKRQIAAQTPSRTEAGLPENGLVFCSFNASYKITPEVFSCWMRILKQTGDSVLWLRENNPMMASNLRLEAQKLGISPDRLVFAPSVKLMKDHLARLRLADLFLDTFPFTAHTTSVDALWSGLPVLTRMGQSPLSRLAGSILSAIGTPELITSSIDEYERLAVELATQPERLANLRQRLVRNRLTTPLFDSALYTRHVENVLAQMYERYQCDLAPEHIHVKPEQTL